MSCIWSSAFALYFVYCAYTYDVLGIAKGRIFIERRAPTVVD